MEKLTLRIVKELRQRRWLSNLLTQLFNDVCGAVLCFMSVYISLASALLTSIQRLAGSASGLSFVK